MTVFRNSRLLIGISSIAALLFCFFLYSCNSKYAKAPTPAPMGKSKSNGLQKATCPTYAGDMSEGEPAMPHRGSYALESQLALDEYPSENFNTESYTTIHENAFLTAKENPLSTFSIDVDAASYANCRRIIEGGQLPNKDAVRIEEFVNYFSYDYSQPSGKHPFTISTEMSDCPWAKGHKVVKVGLQGKKIPFDQLPAMNLVFLVDVSGSMSAYNKLPYLKRSLTMLVDKLRPQDKVSIVVYAGAAGLVLPATSGSKKTTIVQSLDKLEAGGSTAGGEGIALAYQVATEQFIMEGINRVILCTDGDFNIGASSDAEMERLIEKKRTLGVYVTVLGFGMGNYKDSKMEVIADKGNGNYYYIDDLTEAEKVLVTQLDGTLYAIAKDVKIQIEFNPALVQSYRLIGYENRLMRKEEFNDDKKDAGELGAGHTVTALYEVVPVGVTPQYTGTVDPLKYQSPPSVNTNHDQELLTVKFRYKLPNDTVSILMTHVQKYQSVSFEAASLNMRFASAVAAYGLLLRDSEFKGDLTWDKVIAMGVEAKGVDVEGYRAEFVRLVRTSATLARTTANEQHE